MTQYQYKTVPFSNAVPFIDQINDEGQNGWKFLMMAQEIDPVHKDFRTGAPKVKMTLVFEKPVHKHIEDEYPDTEADGYVFCGKCGKKLEI